MNTLAWILVLAGVLLARAVTKGRAANVAEDLGDAFLALIRIDAQALREVNARVGDDFTPAVGKTGEAIGSVAGNAATQIVAAYKLGNVKPHVKAAAQSFGPRFGITDIGGYRAVGSVPGSDHPKGLALDFMVSAKNAESKKRGDALAAALLAEKAQWGVTYVIWNRQINDGSGWRSYSGPSDHTDHVHASFKGM